MSTEYFPGIPKITFEGPKSKNPFAFKHYNPNELVEGKSMRDHLRFAAAYWHVMRNPLADPFGGGTALMPWDDGSNSVANAQKRVRVFFEFLEKIDIDYYCFHDRDVAPELDTLAESHAALDAVAGTLAEEQQRTGKKLLWGTACLFAHPRYAQGGATSPSLPVYTYAAAQVKKAMSVTKELGGGGYVFWGGREGYSSLWNTDMKHELDQLAAFFHMAVAWKKEIGFDGPFWIEPKPREPSTHQYDSDSAACLNFLREYGLQSSMSGKGNCYDNAVVETFFKTIKAELIWRRTWETRRQAETAIFQYINGFYNPRRRHSALGGKSPLAFERQVA